MPYLRNYFSARRLHALHSTVVELAHSFSPLTDLPIRVNALLLRQGQPSPCRVSPYASFLRNIERCGNIDPLPIDYDFRPRLRGRLTLG